MLCTENWKQLSKKEYDAGKVYLMAASSSTAEVTADWISQIRESFREWM